MHPKTTTTPKSSAPTKAAYEQLSHSAIQPGVRTAAAPPSNTAKVMKPKGAKPRAKTPKRNIERQLQERRREPLVSHSCKAWLSLLDSPWTRPNVSCPLSYNPTPTFKTTLLTLKSLGTLTIAANTTTEIFLYPGHGLAAATDPMDGPAFHGVLPNIGGVVKAPGPCSYNGTYEPVAGFIAPDRVINTAVLTTSAASILPLRYDQAAPYVEQTSGPGSHLRSRLNAMGVRLFNETPVLGRGGNIRVVQPNDNGEPAANPGTQASWDSYPTFREYSGTQDSVELNWIPRTNDLAMWHHVNDGEGTTTDYTGAAMRIWINNPTADSQQYELQCIYHYEIGGSSLGVLTEPRASFPSNKNIVEPVLTTLSNTLSGTLKAGVAMAKVAAEWHGAVSPYLTG